MDAAKRKNSTALQEKFVFLVAPHSTLPPPPPPTVLLSLTGTLEIVQVEFA